MIAFNSLVLYYITLKTYNMYRRYNKSEILSAKFPQNHRAHLHFRIVYDYVIHLQNNAEGNKQMLYPKYVNIYAS